MAPQHDSTQKFARTLVIETTICGVSLGLVDDSGELLWQDQHARIAGSTERIATFAAAGLAHIGWKFDQIQGVVVSTGPGSFTGIRVGMAFGLGLSRGFKARLQVLGVSGLAAAAEQWATESNETPCTMLLRSTSTHGYGVRVDHDGDPRGELYGLVTTLDPSNAGSARPLVELASRGHKERFFTIGGWPLAEKLLQSLGKDVGLEELDAATVSAAAIRGMTRQALRRWPGDFQTKWPEPNYMRLSTAEEKAGQPVAGKMHGGVHGSPG